MTTPTERRLSAAYDAVENAKIALANAETPAQIRNARKRLVLMREKLDGLQDRNSAQVLSGRKWKPKYFGA